MTKETFESIKKLLDEANVAYELFIHDHVHTSEDAAKVRGTNIEQAAKAIVLKEKKTGDFFMFVVGGDRRIDLKIVKKEILGVKNVSLAPPDEILERTGCTVGSVPPFGNLFGIKVYFDKHLLETQDEIVFSAGTHNDSIKMKTKEYVRVLQPTIASYSVVRN